MEQLWRATKLLKAALLLYLSNAVLTKAYPPINKQANDKSPEPGLFLAGSQAQELELEQELEDELVGQDELVFVSELEELVGHDEELDSSEEHDFDSAEDLDSTVHVFVLVLDSS